MAHRRLSRYVQASPRADSQLERGELKRNPGCKSRMRILLLDTRKKLYFRHSHVWTANAEAAFDFHETQELFKFVERQSLANVQAVLVLDNPRRCEVVPI